MLSEATFRDITRPHIPVNADISYALGWANYRWNGHPVVEHNGGSQGICALVSFVPDRRVGFALLGNTSPNELTAIGKAGRLLLPLLLEETKGPAPTTAACPAAARPGARPTPSPPAVTDLPTVEDLFPRILAAYGGERNIRRHTRMKVHARKVYENQGVQSDLVILSSAPDSRTEEEAWTAADKPIGRVRSFFDGTRGGQETTFGQDATYAGNDLEQARRRSARHAILDTRKLYSQLAVDRKETLDGEETLVVRLIPRSGATVSLFVSCRTSLILKEQVDGESTTFGDHRNIDGEVVPFRMTVHDSLGESTIRVQDVTFNTQIPTATFGPSKQRRE
jgi:hypothetical protein